MYGVAIEFVILYKFASVKFGGRTVVADIIKLVPKETGTDEHGNGTGDVPAWLRKMADLIEAGEFGTVGAAVVIMREDLGSQFVLRTRRCNMHFIEHAGALHMMHHDMMNAGS